MNSPFLQRRQNPGLSKEKQPPQGAWKLMIFMVGVLIVFLITYFGLKFGYKTYLEAQINKIDAEIVNLSAEIPQEEQAQFLQFQYQLINLRNLLRDHVMSTRIFPLVEANTNQGVYYQTMNLEVGDKRITLRGVAQNYDRLAEQLEAYSRMPGVVRYQISNSTLSEKNQVNFDATLFLDPLILKTP